MEADHAAEQIWHQGNEEGLAERPVCVLLDAACLIAEGWRVSTLGTDFDGTIAKAHEWIL